VKALVTRPIEDAAPLIRALGERGIDTVLAPMLTIRTVDDAERRLTEKLTGVQAVLFTSANGVRAFAAAIPRRELPAFAVGDATAAAARIAGFRNVQSASGDVKDLAALVKARLSPQSGALVHAAGSSVAGDLAGALVPLGFTVHRAVLYDAVPADALDPPAVAALHRGEVGLALFFSPRTAASFARLAAAADVAGACRSMAAFALSPAVAEALETLTWRALRVAASATQRELLAALDAYLAAET
jgi:uroporphyrinogen-III synthase